ncbi:AraC family transcriptional regulator [Bosea sp. NPDC055332]
MSVADTALWIMERNSSQELSLGSIAAACKVSRSHLANAFGTASGWPVMAYLRARRLSEAAKRLAAGAPDILSVALEFGYGSHEAFTRAFRDQFGITPEEVRNAGRTDRLALVAPLRLTNGCARTPIPTLRTLGRLRLVGLSAPCSYESAIGIPAQWQTFMCDHYADIADKAPGIPIGVCRAPDEDGCFEYMCAAEVSSAVSPRKPLAALEIEPGNYAVFEHRDHISTIFDTYTAIWNEALPAAGLNAANGPVLEFHNDDFDPGTGLGGLTIWIPLEREGGGR